MSTVTDEVVVAEAAPKKHRSTNKQIRIAIIAVAATAGIQVIFKSMTTRVVLPGNTSGKSKCNSTEDDYNPLTGYVLAYNRATVRAAEKAITRLRRQTTGK